MNKIERVFEILTGIAFVAINIAILPIAYIAEIISVIAMLIVDIFQQAMREFPDDLINILDCYGNAIHTAFKYDIDLIRGKSNAA